jgi:protein-tyrosine phosphatase
VPNGWADFKTIVRFKEKLYFSPIFIRLCVIRKIHANFVKNDGTMEKFKILFVCLGNICRSPAGEGIMRMKVISESLQDKIEVDSAGILGYHAGEMPDARMRQHGTYRGYRFDSRSRKVTAADFDRFDMIVAMDDRNYDDLLDLCPDLESRHKIRKMADFLRKIPYDHVPDPYYSGASGFELALDLLEDGCQNLLEEVKRMVTGKLRTKC